MIKRIVIGMTAAALMVNGGAFSEMAYGAEEIQSEQSLVETVYADSGCSSSQKLTLDELRNLYNSIGTYSGLYDVDPVITLPDYRISGLTSEALKVAEDCINYYRTVAGLGSITMADAANESAAYGALVLAMNDEMNHTPSQPDGMSDEDYAKGLNATRQSNLSYSSGYSSSSVIPVAI